MGLAAIFFAPGLAVGSFLNVVAARVPLRRSIVHAVCGRTACAVRWGAEGSQRQSAHAARPRAPPAYPTNLARPAVAGWRASPGFFAGPLNFTIYREATGARGS